MKTENYAQYDTDETNGMGLQLDSQILLNKKLKKENTDLLNVCDQILRNLTLNRDLNEYNITIMEIDAMIGILTRAINKATE